MRQKNGFTLLELLGVIVILVLVIMLVSPVIQKQVKKSHKIIDNAQIENIKAAANNWVIDMAADHPASLPSNSGDMCFITISTLKNGGYIDEDLKDTTTNTEISDDLQIVITYQKKQFVYKIDGDLPEEKRCNVN